MKETTEGSERKRDSVQEWPCIGGEVVLVPIDSVRPSPENNELYAPPDADAPEMRQLIESIRARGVLEPLKVTKDGFIISGHRRHFAAHQAEQQTIPILRDSRARDEFTNDEFLQLLAEPNRQRVKTIPEMAREAVALTSPADAYKELVAYRKRKARVRVEAMTIDGTKRRAIISKAKQPFLDAVVAILNELRDHWPLTVRGLHYQLLNKPPLRHSGKPGSRYANTAAAYKDLTNLCSRARHDGFIPWEAIHDPTRPVTTWRVYRSPSPFFQDETEGFLRSYSRDLLQSQPNQVEIVAEKMTVQKIVERVAGEYTVPFTIGRGFSSVAPLKAMSDRFKKCGKSRLILLHVSDCDPEGDETAACFARSMRDEFGIDVHPRRAALTRDQAQRYKLPRQMVAKEGSVNRAKFIKRHRTDSVFELEALRPDDLANELRRAIESVLDMDAFAAEREREAQDAREIEGRRKVALQAMGAA